VARVFFGGVLVIALFLVGVVAAITWVTSDERAASPAAPPDGLDLAALPEPPALFAAPAVPAVPAQGAVAAPEPTRAPARVVSTDGSEARARITVARQHARVSFRSELKAGIVALAERASRCAPQGLADASFVLTAEAVEGGLRIVEVGVEPADRAEDPKVACALSALRGAFVTAASVEPGRRWQLPLSLRPGSRQHAASGAP
jgi:hypothetical protein